MRKIAGRHVYLAPLDLKDAEQYVEWLNDFETTAFLYAYHQVITRENELEWLRTAALKGEPQFGIRLMDDDRLIGNCGLNNVNHVVGKAEMGIFLGEGECRGRGLGEEAVRLLLDFGFNVLNLHCIWLKVFAYNRQALQCYRKCGFKEAGRLREAMMMAGERHDEIMMDILAAEFGSYVLRDRFQDIIAPADAGPQTVPPAATVAGAGSLDKKGVR